MNESVYKNDINYSLLTSNTVTHSATSNKTIITKCKKISEAMENERVHKNLLPEVHTCKLICLYFIVPVIISKWKGHFL